MTPDEPRNEFYIGYEHHMPAGVARRVVVGVMCFAWGAAIAVTTALLAERELPPSRFEFGVAREWTGQLRREPYPSLDTSGGRLLLAGPGKSGADTVVADAPDGPVSVRGSLIERGRHQMVEVQAIERAPVQVRGEPAPQAPGTTRVTLRGEIVDSKCFLGVMNPGEGTVHRDCATRCLSGGMPPMLVVRGVSSGTATHAVASGFSGRRSRTGEGGSRKDLREELVLLVSGGGQPIGRALAPLAGRPVEVTGRLARDGEGYVLRADPDAYRPTPSTLR